MSNALQRDLAKIVAAVDERAAREGHGKFSQLLHAMPPTGWMNDPNGLCQKDGVYHLYFQYAPFDCLGGVKCWGHFESHDLVTWEYVGAPLLPDEPFDVHGVYSGSALVEDGRMRVLYTGNVKLPDTDAAFDYINTGRRADTVLVESEDGRTFGEKRVVLSSDDYPKDLTCHVRDPKLWKDESGRYHMVLGARRRVEGEAVPSRFASLHGEGAGRDVGEVLVYGSDDLLAWELENRISTPERFGFMWECPGYLELTSAAGPARFLSVSPQGLEGGDWDRRNIYHAGYFPVEGDICGDCSLGAFRLWDCGFDFYAPQEFEAEDGRRILIAWMGIPDEPSYGNDPTVEAGWQHCMTVPRELTAGEGSVVLQQPVSELASLRKNEMTASGSIEATGSVAFDLEVTEIGESFSAVIGGELALALKPAEGELPQRFEMRFASGDRASAGCGRAVRWEPIDVLKNVRIVADASSVEVFVNDGALVMSTRIYPDEHAATIEAAGSKIAYWELG